MNGQKFEQRICGVCGDRAFGYNFNAITCESCKAFFRRNAAKHETLKCAFQNQCIIVVLTRKFCARCRLDKCVAIGMSEERKRSKKIKIIGNKTKKKLCQDRNVAASVPYAMSHLPVVMQSTSTNRIFFNQNVSTKSQARVRAMPQQSVSAKATESCPVFASCTVKGTSIPAQQKQVDIGCQDLSFSKDLSGVNSMTAENNLHTHNDIVVQNDNCALMCHKVKMLSCEEKCEDNDDDGINNIIYKNWPFKTAKNVLEIAVSAEYSHLANRIGRKYFDLNVLTNIETQKIDELLRTCPYLPYFLQTVSGDQLFCKKSNNVPLSYRMAVDRSIRWLIKWSKRITAFKTASEEDQIALLKGNSLELLLLWCTIVYNPKIDGWKESKGIWVTMDQLKELKGNNYEILRKFVKSFDQAWRNDVVIILILITIVLLTPKHPNISHPAVFEKERYSYYFLLQRYLSSKHPRCNAQVQFMKLIQTAEDLKTLCKLHVNTFKVEHHGPLITEIFDS